MKKTIILTFLLLLIYSSCEKVVEIDVISTSPKLLIDAVFEVYFQEKPITAKTIVSLKTSADYFDTEIPAVTNATVFVTNLTNGNRIDFIDSDATGNFKPNTNFIPADNTEYELTVIYNNETYKAKATKIKTPTITNIAQGDKTLFEGTETEIIVDFTDPADQQNYYLINYSSNFYDALEDRFFNGTAYNFSEFFDEDELILPTTITVKMSGITKDFFTYFRVLIDQSGESSGGPFETVPSTLLGNIINTTTDSNFPLGYFHIGDTDTFTLDLIDKN